MIEVKNLSFSYGQKKILDQVSFQLDSGEFMAVLGVNGVGKSTLITCMNRIHKPQNGVVLMNGQNVLSPVSYTHLQPTNATETAAIKDPAIILPTISASTETPRLFAV